MAKRTNQPVEPQTFKEGDVVTFTGRVHHIGSVRGEDDEAPIKEFIHVNDMDGNKAGVFYAGALKRAK